MRYIKVLWWFVLIPCSSVFCQDEFTIHDIHRTKKIACTPVQNQAMSSTCWSFASTSFLESEMLRKGIPVVDLSEMFIARYAYFNKIREHLRLKGKTFFTPGGQFHDVVKVVKEFGLMPESAYTGNPVPVFGYDHSLLDTLVNHFVKELLAKGVYKLEASQKNHLDSLFDRYLGKIPKEFLYKGKMYTPLLFAKKIVKLQMDDFVELTSYNHHPMYRTVILEDKYNWSKDGYWNIPFNDFIAVTEAALKNNYTVCWDGDVTERDFHFDQGTARLLYKIQNLENYRNRTFLDSSSTIDHMMHVVGTGIDGFGNKWFYLKNSWGSGNALKGFLYMDADYFSIKTVAIIVNKNAIPPAIRKKSGI
jgi:bleomycin hydrolase